MNSDRISLLKKFISEEPTNPFNKYALAMEYYETQLEESLSLLRSLLADHPDYLPTYFKAAHLLWENENWDEADEVFQTGIKLAEQQEDQKALQELKAAYLNFEFDRD
ncbi:tetratricopeptide repeat protein [Ekhidna sp.]|uniref:tetratricopeptide repeat protein n=1 Tax=Ekhidna sp. TaxID=2608089 RepID=UPI003CCBDE6D